MKTLTVGGSNKTKDVILANAMLMGHNRFGHQTLFQSQNKVFTKASGEAAKRMKFWLGYKKSLCTPVFGDELRGYLDEVKLTPTMTARRIARKIIKPQPTRKYVNPIKIPWKHSYIGGPGQGTHSFHVPPDNWQSDNAVDIACKRGTPLVAVADGSIGNKIGALETHGDPHMLGLRFYLDDEYGNSWYYAHCSKISVHAGQKVKQGDSLALSGTANSVDHLHIACQYGNPTKLLPK